MSQRVTIEISDHIADVRLNRPDRHNALDAEQFEAIYEAGLSLREQPGLRAIVLSGNGPSFCSGLDFPSFMQPGQDLGFAFRREDGSPANHAQRVVTVWREQQVPVIAALHGVAFGGGFQIAMGADLRIAATDTRLCIMEIDYGLIPDMAISQTLPRLLPQDQAMELILTGRKIDADEAVRLGLVTRLAEDAHASAMDLARQIAARSPDAVRANKALIQQCWPADPALLAEEARLQQKIMEKANHREAVSAKLGRRPARFED